MSRLGFAGLALLVAGACSSHDHVTDPQELVDSWNLVGSDTHVAKTVHFSSTLAFSMTLSDGSPSTGTYNVMDPLLLVSPTNPAGTVWCTPQVTFSDSDNTLTFEEFDPAKCGESGTQSPLIGVYKHVD